MLSMADGMFPDDPPAPATSTAASPYLVLARKYRPLSFSSLIGQDAMVQTLRNAFRSGRIHHAFILTAIRLDPREQQAVVVASVAPNSPAAEAGVRSGDMITAVNRTPVHTPAEFVDIASQLGPNDPVQLSLNRVQNVNVSPVQRTSVVVDVTPVAPAPAAPGVVVPAGRPVRVAPAPGGPVRRIIRGRP